MLACPRCFSVQQQMHSRTWLQLLLPGCAPSRSASGRLSGPFTHQAVTDSTPHTALRLAVKANICVEGMPTCAASNMLKGFVPSHTATVVHRLREQSPRRAKTAFPSATHIVGMTNMDEFGMGSACVHSYAGACVNPHSAGFTFEAVRATQPHLPEPDDSCWLTAGGSSGGAAVAVASGLADVSVGTDTGGSVRLPASFCGVVGFKPSYGRIPRHGVIAYASSLDTVGFLARSVSACASSLCVSSTGTHTLDDTSLAYEEDDAMLLSVGTDAEDGQSLKGVRVGLLAEASVAELPPHVRRAVCVCAHALTRAGAQVVTVSVPAVRHALPAYYVLAAAEASSNLSRYDGIRYGHRAAEAPGASVPQTPTQGAAALHAWMSRTRSEGFGPEVQRRILAGNFVLSQESRAAFYMSAMRLRRFLVRQFNAVLRPVQNADLHAARASALLPMGLHSTALGEAANNAGVDLILTPTAPSYPWPVFATTQQPAAQMFANDVMTIPPSLARLPAVSVPVGFAPYPVHQLTPRIREAYSSHLSMLRVPVGMQLYGRALDDAFVLRAAATLHRAAQAAGHI